MQLNINLGQQSPFASPAFGRSNPALQMMFQMMQMMMGMLMRMMGGQGACRPTQSACFPQQSPGFGGSSCGGGFGGGSPLERFLGGGPGGGGCPTPAPFGSRQPGCSGAPGGGYQHNPNAGHPLSPRSVELIAKSEGFDQPGKWPGYKSGITIGVGYDLGYCTRQQLYKDWKGKIPDHQLARLSNAIGLKGQAARSAASQFRDIQIPQNAAMDVFQNSTLPKYYQQACQAFPGLDRLPPDAQGALTSIVFNRGAAMSGDRRLEMRQIRDAVAGYNGQGSLDYIAGRIQSMKRLWVGQGVDGLLVRRDREAALLRQSTYS